MYSKEEAAKIRQSFWITFGKYMKPIPSADGLPVNWINYKTGVKHIFFRLDADKRGASIAIELAHPDAGLRELYFEQFEALKLLLTDALGEEWEWQAHATNDFGFSLSRIVKTVDGLSIYKQEDWPNLISFLKPRLIALDQFWADVKPIFEAL